MPERFGVLLHELRDAAGREAGPVGPDEQLAVGVRTGADADRGDLEQLGDLSRRVGGHHLEHDGERAGILHRLRVGEAAASTPSPRPWMMWPPRPCSLCGVKPMCAITGMPAPTMRRICLSLRTPPSSFTACAPGLLHEPDGRVQRVFGAVLVGAERHVGDDERALHRTGHGARERDQFVDRDGQRGVVAEARCCRPSRRRAGSRCPPRRRCGR